MATARLQEDMLIEMANASTIYDSFRGYLPRALSECRLSAFTVMGFIALYCIEPSNVWLAGAFLTHAWLSVKLYGMFVFADTVVNTVSISNVSLIRGSARLVGQIMCDCEKENECDYTHEMTG